MAQNTLLHIRTKAGFGKKIRRFALLFLALLPVHAAHASVSMETGNQGMRLDGQGLTFYETIERGQGDLIMQTPPRENRGNAPAQNLPQELPFGIVPEVHILWQPPAPQPPIGTLPQGALPPPSSRP